MKASSRTPDPSVVLPLDAIRVGRRFRKHMGDLEGLAASIQDHGLLHPIVITPERELVAGERRLAAVRLLGWKEVPVTIVTPADMLRAENDENVIRLDFSPSEAADVARVLRPIEERQARERQGARTDLTSGKVFQKSQSRAADRIAAAVGLSRPTLEKIEAVVQASDDDPEMGDLVALMDEKGKVDGAYRELQRRRARANAATTPSPVEHVGGQKYRTIVIDPPWDPADEGDVDQMGRAQPLYGEMPIAEVRALPLADLADPAGCHLYLWITNRSLPKGFDLIEAWGFRYVTALTWCKPSIGVGNYFRNNTEHVLFGVRGSLQLLEQNIPTWFQAPRGAIHSRKPEEFFEMVRKCSPGPRLEMFARGSRDGFATWGSEAA